MLSDTETFYTSKLLKMVFLAPAPAPAPASAPASASYSDLAPADSELQLTLIFSGCLGVYLKKGWVIRARVKGSLCFHKWWVCMYVFMWSCPDMWCWTVEPIQKNPQPHLKKGDLGINFVKNVEVVIKIRLHIYLRIIFRDFFYFFEIILCLKVKRRIKKNPYIFGLALFLSICLPVFLFLCL